MKKFYAVTKGCYSDYHIITITDNKENAERIAAAYWADVEEYEDNIVNPIGLWWVQRDEYENGDVKWGSSSEDPDLFDEDDINKPPMAGTHSFGGIKSHYWAIYILAKDREHAIKGGQDQYAQWEAEQEGVS